MKRGILVLLFLICIALVSAVNSIEVSLTKTSYSSNENFKGDLIINDSAVDISKTVKGTVSDCGSYSKEAKLYEILNNAGLYSGSGYDFAAGTAADTVQMSLPNNGSDIVGFDINNRISYLNFTVSGSGSGLYVDVGADGTDDYHYVGAFTGWGTAINPIDYSSSYNVANADDFDPRSEACDEISISFDELTSELLVQVNGYAKNTGSGGSLSASIGAQTCDFGTVGGSWTGVSCSMTLDVEDYESPRILEVCYETNDDNFKVPVMGNHYYFSNVQIANYRESLGEKVFVSDSGLKNAINDYYDSCPTDWCLVPLEFKLTNFGVVVLDDLELSFGGRDSHSFYSVNLSGDVMDLSDTSIPLSSFSELKTPDVEEEDSCSLKIEFDGKSDSVPFNISAGPTAVIKVSSYYMGKDLPIEFDASSSSSKQNKTVSSWNWNFGDNKTGSGEKVSHSYSEDGNYTVELTVKDSSGLESSTSVVVHIVPLEDYLTDKFAEMDDLFVSANNFFDGVSGDMKRFSDFMDYGSLLNSSLSEITSLESNFTSVKDSNASSKDSEYAIIANDLYSVTSKLPLSLRVDSSRSLQNFFITGPDDVFSFSGAPSVSDEYASAVYSFNKDNVDVDVELVLFDVDFFDGSSDYLFVEKTVSASAGTDKVIVEDVREFGLDKVVSNADKDSDVEVLYWSMSGNSQSIEYAVELDYLAEINTIVYSDVDVSTPDNFYCFVGPGCEKYCGDGDCSTIDYLGVDESDELNEFYCAIDCAKKEVPILRYIILGAFFLLLLFYLFIYRGPGNFKDFANKISYGLVHKKLFVSERDKVILHNFILDSLRRGYNADQIRSALMKKGWDKGQINHILENYIKR